MRLGACAYDRHGAPMTSESFVPALTLIAQDLQRPSSDATGPLDEAVRRNVELIASAIAQARLKVDQRVALIKTLQQLATGDPDVSPDLESLTGAWALRRDLILAPSSRQQLNRWSTYFAPDIHDVEQFRDEIQHGMITDPRTMYDIVEIADDLLSAAEYAVQEASDGSEVLTTP